MTFAANDAIERRKGLGGSDAGAANGLNPYMTPLRLWMLKTGRIEPENLDDNDAVQFGLQFEDAVAKFARKKFNLILSDWDEAYPARPPNTWMYAHPDRINLDCPPGLAEIKTTALRVDRDGLPPYWLAQGAHYLACYPEMERVIFLVLQVGSRKLHRIDMERDQAVIDRIVEGERRFWEDCVMADVPPPATSEEDLKLLWPTAAERSCVVAPAEIQGSVGVLRETKALIKHLEEKEERLTFQIKDFMQNSEILSDGDKALATWSNRTSSRLDQQALKQAHPKLVEEFMKESTSRFFLIKK